MTEEKTRKKVGVEDIIGIVKTDEATNSVELKKQIIYHGLFSIFNDAARVRTTCRILACILI